MHVIECVCLQTTKARLRVSEEQLKALEWEHEVLEQRFAKVITFEKDGITAAPSHTRWHKKSWHTFLYAITSYALTSSNIVRFSNLFHCLNQVNICNNTATKDPITTLWDVSVLKDISVLKATIENKKTSVTTHFKKLTTGNNMYIVSVLTI